MTKTKHDEIVDQLDQFYVQAKRQILQNQSAITGLFPASSCEKSSASIKTSLWAASSVHALYLAYSKRVDNDQGRAHDLGQSVVKCMRGILFAWMRQSEKVESFKANQCPKHALHLKFDLHSGLANDFEYPHLQIDVVSLYLIFLANFIASGLDIIYCMDEVTFIQNLVYYVERAYRTPDYGSWELTNPTINTSGATLSMANKQTNHTTDTNQSFDEFNSHATSASTSSSTPMSRNNQSTNQQFSSPQAAHSATMISTTTPVGPHQQHPVHHSTSNTHSTTPHQDSSINYHQPNSCAHCSNEGQQLEIHATSIGMAKSALEAINGCNLFGGKGANWSIIYSDIDAHSRNRSIFETLLPRESRSKNTDSYLLATISWPCFATSDPVLYSSTKGKILRKLKGKYGLKRFLRDPYGTVLSVDVANNSINLDKALFLSASTTSNTTHSKQRLSTTNGPFQDMFATNQQQPLVGTTSHHDVASSPASPFVVQREASFSSTTSGGSSVSQLNEQPKTKQRKSSYFQRKNFFRNTASYMTTMTTATAATTTTSTSNAINTANQQQQDLLSSAMASLQRTESESKMSKRFEHIESEWPLFICFLIIDGIFKQDIEQIHENEKLLYEKLLIIDPKHGDYVMPKYYFVPPDLIYNEKCRPDSVERVASFEGSSNSQLYLTGQSILLIARLLLAGLLHPNELDPLRRHMPSHDRPKRIGRYSSFQATSPDLVVQTVLIAESIRLQAMMANYGIQTQTPREVEPVQIWSSAQLVKVYEYLGVNQKLGLKGRPARPIGALGTSKLYRICGQTIICYPLIFEVSDFYLAQDMLLLIDDIQNELNFIGRYWRMSGRPTVCIIIREEHLRDVHFRDLLDLLVQFKNGQLKKSGLRIKTGRLQNLISSSCIEHLDFLHLLPHEHLPQFKSFCQLVESPKESLLLNPISRQASFSTKSHVRRRQHQQTPCGIGQVASASSSLKTKRQLCSASSNNLQAIEEQANMSCDDTTYEDALEGEHHQSYNALGGADDESLQKFAEQLDFNMSDASMYKFSSLDLEHNYSTTEPSNSIDYYECYKEAPTWPTLIELLKTCTDLGGQSQLLAILWEREGAKYSIDDSTVEDRLERLSQLACHARNWSVVRYCSSVLKRSVESLSPWLTSILVNGKQISLGTGTNERIISNPLTPTEIHTLIYSTVNTKNPCDAVLQQEIALYIGRLISTRPDYFDGILTIRVANFMSAMRSYLSIKNNEKKMKLQHQQKEALAKWQCDEQNKRTANLNYDHSTHLMVNDNDDEELLDLRIKQEQQHEHTEQTPQASTSFEPQVPQIKVESASNQQQCRTQASGSNKFCSRYGKRAAENLIARPLESLSPSDVRKLLVKVLAVDEEHCSLPISDRRQITGELCRVPKDFYDKVWSLLHCTSVGIVIGGRILRSAPILTNMTQDDLNFALKVESLLSLIDDPKLRQINVELLVALHVLFERNPEIRFENEPLDLDRIIQLSLEKFRKDYQHDDYGLREFYSNTTQTAMLYTVRTVFDCLLPAKFRGSEDGRSLN